VGPGARHRRARDLPLRTGRREIVARVAWRTSGSPGQKRPPAQATGEPYLTRPPWVALADWRAASRPGGKLGGAMPRRSCHRNGWWAGTSAALKPAVPLNRPASAALRPGERTAAVCSALGSPDPATPGPARSPGQLRLAVQLLSHVAGSGWACCVAPAAAKPKPLGADPPVGSSQACRQWPCCLLKRRCRAAGAGQAGMLCCALLTAILRGRDWPGLGLGPGVGPGPWPGLARLADPAAVCR